MTLAPPVSLQQGFACMIAPRSGSEFNVQVIDTPKFTRTGKARYDVVDLTIANTLGNFPAQSKDAVRVYENGILVFHGLIVSRPEVKFKKDGFTARFTAASRPFLLWKKLTRDWQFPGIDDEQALKAIFGTEVTKNYLLADLSEFDGIYRVNVPAGTNRLQLAESVPGTFHPSGYASTDPVNIGGGEIQEATFHATFSGSRRGEYDDDFSGSSTPAIINGATTTAYYDAFFEEFRLQDRTTAFVQPIDDANFLADQEGVGVVSGALTLQGVNGSENFELPKSHSALTPWEKTVGSILHTKTFVAADFGLAALTKCDGVWEMHRTSATVIRCYATMNIRNSGAVTGAVVRGYVDYTPGTGFGAWVEIAATTDNTTLANFLWIHHFQRGAYNYIYHAWANQANTIVGHEVYAIDGGPAIATTGLPTPIGTGGPLFRRMPFDWKDNTYFLYTSNTTKTYYLYNSGTNSWATTTDPVPTLSINSASFSVLDQHPQGRIRSRGGNALWYHQGTQEAQAGAQVAGSYFDGNAWTTLPVPDNPPTSGATYYKTRYFLNPDDSQKIMLASFWVDAVQTLDAYAHSLSPIVAAPGGAAGAFGSYASRIQADTVLIWGLPRSVVKGSLKFDILLPTSGDTGAWRFADGRYMMRVLAGGTVQWRNVASAWTSLATVLDVNQPQQIRIDLKHTGSVGTWTARVYLRGIDNGLIGPAQSLSNHIGAVVWGDTTDGNHDIYVDNITWNVGFDGVGASNGYADATAVATTYPTYRADLAVVENKPVGTNVRYYLSFDSGVTFLPIVPGTPLDIFLAQGSTAIVRVQMDTINASKPTVSSYTVTLHNGYTTGAEKFTTLNLNPDTLLTVAFVTVEAATEVVVPANTTVNWRVSSNGGITWSAAILGAETTIPPAERGTTVLVEASFTTTNQAVTGKVRNLHVNFRDAASGTTISAQISRDGGITYHAITDGQTIDFTAFPAESPQNELVVKFDLATTVTTASPSVQDVSVDILGTGFTWFRLGLIGTQVVPLAQGYPIKAYYRARGPLLEELVQKMGVEAWWELDPDTGIYILHYNHDRDSGSDRSGELGVDVLEVVVKTDGLKSADRWYLIGEA